MPLKDSISERNSNQKELCPGHKLFFSNSCIFTTQWRRPWIFQAVNYVRSENLSFKYKRFTPSGFLDKGTRKFEFVLKTPFF